MPIDLDRWKKAAKGLTDKAKEAADKAAKDAAETKMPGGPSPLSGLKSVKLPSLSKEEISKLAKEAAPKVGQMAVKGARVGVYGLAVLFYGVTGIKIPAILDKPPPSSEPYRPMKFPYTFTAKVVQFPWIYYLRANWVYRYYVIALVVSFPIIKKIHNVFNSPANVKKWEEIKRKEREEEEHH